MSSAPPANIAASLEERGFAIVESVLPDATIDALVSELASDRNGSLYRQGAKFGGRNLLDAPGAIHELSRSPEVRNLVAEALPGNFFAVRGLFFDKAPGANWNLPWHQDLAIAVAEQREVPGFGPWSTKAGVPHVHVPEHVLESMVAIRIHLDDCPAENGALQVIPGSHKRGKMTFAQIHELALNATAFVCPVPRGGALIMAPLLVHASRPSEKPAHRRVIHIEYANCELEQDLEWRWRIDNNREAAPIESVA